MALASHRNRWIRVGLRTLALSVAIVGFIDPAMTSTQRSNAVVSVVAVDAARDSATAMTVATSLAKRFQVVPARFPRADATVIVGDGVPQDRDGLAPLTFAVAPDSVVPAVSILAVRTSLHASVSERVPVAADIRVRHASGQLLSLALRMNGVLLDTASRAIRSADTVIHATLIATPNALGSMRLRVTATLAQIGEGNVSLDSAGIRFNNTPATTADAMRKRADADVALFVGDQPMAVLVYDPRPSWMSTFVRRALEQDTRFRITSRVVTSREISTASGAAPAHLDNAASLEPFATIVIGAPELLTAREVDGLEAFLRRRGGSVILLLDQRVDGPFGRLPGVGAWDGRSLGAAMRVGRNDGSVTLRASELAWPSSLPEGATELASVLPSTSASSKAQATAPAIALSTSRDDATLRGHPVVWRTAVGAGQLIVSGALDAWRFRDSTMSSFDAYWQSLIAEAASNSPPPMIVSLAEPLLHPGESTELFVAVRSAVLRDGATSAELRQSNAAATATSIVSATLESGESAALQQNAIRLWPDGAIGTFRGNIRAPAASGPARITVHIDDLVGEVTLLVDSTVHRVTRDDAALQRAWVAARHGTVVTQSQTALLADDIAKRVKADPRRERWYPMRSVWWLLPFAAALSFEWWLRRRGGLV